MASVRKRAWKTAAGEARTAWTVDFVTTSGERERRQFATKREADACRVEIEGQIKAGTFRPDAAKVTVAEACDGFLEHCRGRMARGERMTRHNVAVLDGHIYNYVCPDPERHLQGKAHPKLKPFTEGIGAIKLAQLTARGVNDFRDRLRTAGVSVQTTRKIIATLHNVLEFAIGRDLIAVNAARGVKVIGRRDEGSKKIVPPTKEAMRALIDAADQDLKVKLIVAAATGMRAGEFHAARWRHVDFDKAELTVETRVDTYGAEDVTKTAAGMRTIPLGQPVILALKAWKLRSTFKKPDDLIFPNTGGKYDDHDNFVKREYSPLFDRLAEFHNADPHVHPKIERINWHALRHYAISTWIEAGLSPKTVQTFAGHSSLAVTMDRYGHLFKSASHKEAMDTIAKGLFS